MRKQAPKQLKNTANLIRQDIIEMLSRAGSGHPGGALGMADIFTALYFNILKYNPKKPNDPKRDRLVLSNGHICPVLYSSLARAVFFDIKKLSNLRKFASPLQGHPHFGSLPGIENSSGPLGQGISQAVGMALAAKMNKAKHHVFCITSDGEHNEGQVWEALMLANKHKLNNLVNIVDQNNIQIDGTTNKIMPLGSLKKKYQSFGWSVLEIDGHDIEAILKALKKAKLSKQKPVTIIAKTTLGKGVSFMENDYNWHGKAPNREETKQALLELKYEK